jgi:DNA-directed RNA polymerase II subunit RPB2
MTEQINPWKVIETYTRGDHLARLVAHQVDAYNDLITRQIPRTVEMFNPIIVHSDNDRDPVTGKYAVELALRLDNFSIHRPQIHENNGATKIMYPHDARLRGFTYAGMSVVDLDVTVTVREGEDMLETRTFNRRMERVRLGAIPIMLQSCVCVLKQYAHHTRESLGECRVDPGGYFIINGAEKAVLAQERAAENLVYAFRPKSGRWGHTTSIRSVPDDRRVAPKQLTLLIAAKETENGREIHAQLPRLRATVPLFVLFRALGVLSDKAICEHIVLDLEDEHSRLLLRDLRASAMEAADVPSAEQAFEKLAACVSFIPFGDPERAEARKRQYVRDMLAADFLPHCPLPGQKVLFLGHMARELLRVARGERPVDDRDAYENKRVDTAGTLLNNLFRAHMGKVVKDIQKQVVRELNSGSWRTTRDYLNIITSTNVYKIVKSATIENGLRRALSTGDFGTKTGSQTKQGVAQVLNRLSYISSLSHLRRVNTPIDKSGKLVPPRKLHGSSFGFICPAETPEGGAVGVVKNLALMTRVSAPSSSEPLHTHVREHVVLLSDVEALRDLAGKAKVFINGTWIGITKDPLRCCTVLRYKKAAGILNIHTSVAFDTTRGEIHLCSEGGRLLRPLLRVENGELLILKRAEALAAGTATWDSLLVERGDEPSVIEYIDATEQARALVAMWPRDLRGRAATSHTHCEIHPSTILGVVASCIPYPDHNQSPRNTYQCAMGKQAMGVYTTNFADRMDKTGYVMTYPTRPLVDTRVMNMLRMNDVPSGAEAIVAIMSYSGFNQEDSVIFNQGALERGLFSASICKTEKDEDKKASGEEEIRCVADPERTRGMKFADYSKLAPDGTVPEGTMIHGGDVIIGKVVPIRDARGDQNKVIKYQDHSKVYKGRETSYVDRNVTSSNGDGYAFTKVRMLSYRVPEIGDKFSSRHGQKGTIGIILPEEDMPFAANGLKPDIIINPHAIPSRMTIGQLKETLLGKVLVELGLFGDGSAFGDLGVAEITRMLAGLGHERYGNERLTNGMTGEQITTSIFIGPVFYQRLKHMVRDKEHSRGEGSMMLLTRQPGEGRAKKGGLRFGEMERDCTISHGAARFTKERVYDVSDAYVTYTCDECGLVSAYNDEAGIHFCRTCENRTRFSKVAIPYACKLLFQELMTMNIAPRVLA